MDPTKVVKVAQARPADYHLGVVDKLLGRSVPDPNQREFQEYQRLIRAGVPLTAYFPRVVGFVETDIGPGLCAERLAGEDGRPPISISAYTRGIERPSDLSPDFILKELKTFGAFCARYGILAACDEPHNIGFVRQGSGYRCVAYDLKIRPNKELLPIATLLLSARRRKVARRFARTVAKVQSRLGLAVSSVG